MSVYRKDDNGNIKKIAGSLTQRINMHIFQTTHEFDTEKNEDNYIINESDAKPYISSIKDWTQYSINLSEPNESSNINIKLGSQTLKLINNVKNIEIGTLNGVIQCHTEKLDNNEIFLNVVGTVVSLNGVEKTSINTDTTPTANSENLITSGGVHDYPAITFAESERQKSKNLFDINNTVLDYSLNLGETGQQLNIASTSKESYGRCCTNINKLIKVKPNTQYVITTNSTFKYSLGQISASRLVVTETGWKTDSTLTITTSSTTEYVAFNFGKTDDSKITSSDFSNFLLSHIQIEEGSVATDWQPYNGQISHSSDKEIAFAEKEYQKSKNLLDINKAEFKSNSQTYSTLSGGTITINAGNQFCYISSLTNLCNLKPNIPYTLSYVTNNGSSYIYQYIEGATGFKWDNGETKIFSQTDLDRIANNLLLLYGSTDSTVTYSNIQIEEGSTATDWQPYNGAIVHKLEIEPVLIYDIDTKNTIGGTAYTAGLNGNVTQVISSDIKRLRFYCQCRYGGPIDTGGTSNIFELSLDNRHNSYAQAMYVVPRRSGNNYLTSGLIAVGLEQSTSGDLGVYFSVDDVLVTGIDYYCYRIEGIK